MGVTGTIPPSSSGTSGASSSTQSPMPPSLPSVPSSSTPLPGPIESSPDSQSPTAPASSEPHNRLSLAEKYDREPTPMEAFTYTHTKGHDGNTFVDRCAVGVNENYSTARERLISSRAESEAESRIDELALYLEAVVRQKEEESIWHRVSGITILLRLSS
ncbi:hypothetical protein JCGZ_09143 [Jatropha curcas]|uniref:Uncharacterized protein n=1 Tax=Jatropha curcas TaxID=180498 RepID=A0A067KRE4_JATCU|nr:hypothetical protein JCGZ_09143 [Jatropha curcas]